MSKTAQPVAFSVNPALDLAALHARFARGGRVQVDDFLAPGQADLLREALLARTDWSLVLNVGAKVYDLTRDQRAGMSEGQLAQLDRLVLTAARSGFHYRYEAIRVGDKTAERGGDDLLTAFVRFMASRPALDTLAAITGFETLQFADGQATAYSHGHFLTAHDDGVAGKNRRAAYVLGLTPGWRPEWGGVLMFHGEGGEIDGGFTPQFGSLRLFSVPAVHSVSYVNPIAPEARLSVTGWLRDRDPNAVE